MVTCILWKKSILCKHNQQNYVYRFFNWIYFNSNWIRLLKWILLFWKKKRISWINAIDNASMLIHLFFAPSTTLSTLFEHFQCLSIRPLVYINKNQIVTHFSLNVFLFSLFIFVFRSNLFVYIVLFSLEKCIHICFFSIFQLFMNLSY